MNFIIVVFFATDPRVFLGFFYNQDNKAYLVVFLDGQATRNFLDDEEIIVYTKENKRHDSKYNKFVCSIRSLDQDKNHHNERPYPHKSPDFFSGSSEPKESMVQVSVITLEGTFFHDKHSPQSDPYRVKDYQRQGYDQCSYFGSPYHG